MRRVLAPLGMLLACVLAVPWTRAPQPPVLDEDQLPGHVPALDAADAPRTIEELRKRIGAVLDREGVPGVGIALVGRDGPIWIGGVGVADLTTRAPVDANTVFRVASITKSIVGLGVMRLVEQRKLDLDRPLRALLRDVAIENPWEAVAPVTLAQVLEHTAGLDDMRPSETFTDDDAVTPAVALTLNPRSRKIRWRPGSRMSYSNVGYGLAGRAIELATGEPFDAWLRREVLLPLGMPDADFRRTTPLLARLATGHRDRDRPARFTPIAHRAAGSLLASATDLSKLVQFWLRRGEGMPFIVSPASLDRIERAGTLQFPHTDVEYGLGNHGDVSHPARSRGHDGGLPGFSSSLRYFPELGVGYVILLNATHSFRAYFEIRWLVFAYLARDRVLPEPSTIASPPPDGSFYAFANPRHALFGFIDRTIFGWRATESAFGVRLDPLLGDPFDLVATKDGGYRFPWESGTSVRFTQSRDGTPIMIAHGVYAESGSEWSASTWLTAVKIALLLLLLAPVWATIMLAIAAWHQRPLPAFGLVMWPALAGLCLILLPRVFFEAADAEALGKVHPWTVGIFVLTLLFAIASIAGLVSTIRWWRRTDRPPLILRLLPSAAAVAGCAVTLWLGANGIIGLRTWAW